MTEGVLDLEMVEEARDALGERYPHSVRRLLEDGEKRIDRIRAEIEGGGNWEVVAFEAHTFKSSSACLGAVEFPLLAAEMEHLARQKGPAMDVPALAGCYTRMLAAFCRMKAGFENILLSP